jgi:hypothetical protein
MYKQVILWLVVLGSFCTACRKAVSDQAITAKDISNTKGSCTLSFSHSDIYFKGVYLTQSNGLYNLAFFETNDAGEVETELRIGDIQLSFGKQQLSKTVTDATESQRGAHTCLHTNVTSSEGSEICHVQETNWQQNVLEIYEIDAQTGWVRGRFTCNYVRESFSDAEPVVIPVRGAQFEFQVPR